MLNTDCRFLRFLESNEGVLLRRSSSVASLFLIRRRKTKMMMMQSHDYILSHGVKLTPGKFGAATQTAYHLHGFRHSKHITIFIQEGLQDLKVNYTQSRY